VVGLVVGCLVAPLLGMTGSVPVMPSAMARHPELAAYRESDLRQPFGMISKPAFPKWRSNVKARSSRLRRIKTKEMQSVKLTC
jgi:hypothetical protein